MSTHAYFGTRLDDRNILSRRKSGGAKEGDESEELHFDEELDVASK